MGEMVQIATADAREMKAHNRPMKRRVPGAMSKTEERFAELLNEYARDKQIVSYSFEPVTF